MRMKNILKNRLALSTVVTTLIILVVSVLLAGVVTYFAINVVSVRSQQESISINYAHIWCDATGNAVGGLCITNTGGRDVVINQIEVRGQPVWTADVVTTATGTPTTDLTAMSITDIGKATACTGPIVLVSGTSINVFIASPGSVSTADIGTSIGFTVFTAQAAYYHETNVEASTADLT